MGCVECLDKVIQRISANAHPDFPNCSLFCHQQYQFTGRNDANKTRLSARRKILQKNTQRRTGVRMRYRRTIVRRSKKWMRQGDTPSWRQPANACCYSRALFVALFFAAFSDLEIPDLTPGCFASPTAFSYHLSFALRQTSSRPLPRRIQPEARLMRTTRRNLPMEMWRSTVSARA